LILIKSQTKRVKTTNGYKPLEAMLVLKRFTIFRPISENLETLFPVPENGQKGGLIKEFIDCV
jgi:hypothetical protein